MQEQNTWFCISQHVTLVMLSILGGIQHWPIVSLIICVSEFIDNKKIKRTLCLRELPTPQDRTMSHNAAVPRKGHEGHNSSFGAVMLVHFQERLFSWLLEVNSSTSTCIHLWPNSSHNVPKTDTEPNYSLVGPLSFCTKVYSVQFSSQHVYLVGNSLVTSEKIVHQYTGY